MNKELVKTSLTVLALRKRHFYLALFAVRKGV